MYFKFKINTRTPFSWNFYLRHPLFPDIDVVCRRPQVHPFLDFIWMFLLIKKEQFNFPQMTPQNIGIFIAMAKYILVNRGLGEFFQSKKIKGRKSRENVPFMWLFQRTIMMGFLICCTKYILSRSVCFSREAFILSKKQIFWHKTFSICMTHFLSEQSVKKGRKRLCSWRKTRLLLKLNFEGYK